MNLRKSILIAICAMGISQFLASQDKVNVLWIITDDQRADALSCFNEAVTGKSESPLGYVESPFIDQMASEGVLFTEAFCNSPACAPSRASMHTGKYPFRSGIYGFEQTHPEAGHYNLTVPEEMRSQGYKTSRFGKSGVRIYKWGPGLTWTEPSLYDFVVDMKNNLQKYGFTGFYSNAIWDGAKVGTREEWYYPDGTVRGFFTERTDGNITEEDIAEKASIDSDHDVLRAYTRQQTNLILGGESSQPGSKTLDGRIAEEFRTYLANANQKYKTLEGKSVDGPNTNQAQFIHLGFHFPHTPVLPPKNFRDKFKDKTYKLPDFNEAELDKLPAQLRTLFDKMKIHGMTDDEKQQVIRDYYAFCAFGDSLVGASVNAFKEYCTTNNQEYLILLACGDHGWHLGEQGISAKFGPYDKSNHTAVIAVSSDKTKFPAGLVKEEFVEFVDFAPTIFAAGGADLSHEKYSYLDGHNLHDIVDGTQDPRDYVLGNMNHVYGPRAYIRSKDFAFSMRTRQGNAKPSEGNLNAVLDWALTTSATNAEMALYDLRVDENEQSNVAYDKQYIELAAWLRKKLGNIVLGDGRVECDWTKENLWEKSSFAVGADDKKLNIPDSIIPVLADAEVPLQELSVENNSVIVEKGQSVYITPVYTPFNATNKQLLWETDNDLIVAVNNGVVAGNHVGTTTIEVTSVENNSLKAIVTLEVIPSTYLNPVLLKKNDFKVVSVNSEESGFEKEKVLDNDTSSYWRSKGDASNKYPHEIQIDFGKSIPLDLIEYIPVQDINAPNGVIGKYQVYVSDSKENWGEPVKVDSFFWGSVPNTENYQIFREIILDPVANGKFLKLVLTEEGQKAESIDFSAIAELNFYSRVTGISINQTDTLLITGDELQLSSTLQPNNDLFNIQTNWKVNNGSISSINSDGLFSASATGTVRVTADIFEREFTDVVSIIISDPKIELSKSKLNLSEGIPIDTLYAVTAPWDAEVYWSSDDPSIVEVSPEGIITAKENGKVDITASIEFKGQTYSDVCQVNSTIAPSIAHQHQVDQIVSLFPNPTNGDFTIEAEQNILSTEIIDITGKLITSKYNLNQNQVEFNLQDAGVYFVKCELVNGVKSISKIVKE